MKPSLKFDFKRSSDILIEYFYEKEGIHLTYKLQITSTNFLPISHSLLPLSKSRFYQFLLFSYSYLSTFSIWIPNCNMKLHFAWRSPRSTGFPTSSSTIKQRTLKSIRMRSEHYHWPITRRLTLIVITKGAVMRIRRITSRR